MGSCLSQGSRSEFKVGSQNPLRTTIIVKHLSVQMKVKMNKNPTNKFIILYFFKLKEKLT